MNIYFLPAQHSTFLQTEFIWATHNNGRLMCRKLLDSDCQSSYITTILVKQLRSRLSSTSLTVFTIENTKHTFKNNDLILGNIQNFERHRPQNWQHFRPNPGGSTLPILYIRRIKHLIGADFLVNVCISREPILKKYVATVTPTCSHNSAHSLCMYIPRHTFATTADHSDV